MAKKSKSVCTPDLSVSAESPGQERVLVNITNLDEAIRKSGKSKKDIFESAGVETKNYSNWKRGRRAYRNTLALIATVLQVETIALIQDATLAAVESPIASARIRKLSGDWIIEGGDIQAPPDFVYQPKILGGRIRFEQDELGHFVGVGVDHDQAPLTLNGQLIGPDHVRGEYDIEHPRMSFVSGVLVAKLELCGTKICGYYLGRETGGYGQDFLLGKVTLTLDGSRDD